MPCNVECGKLKSSELSASAEDFLLLCLSNLTIASIQIADLMFHGNCLLRSKMLLRDFVRD